MPTAASRRWCDVTLRWGVAGPGGIAARFAEGMRLVDDGAIVAVASRSIARADAYGDKFGVATRYGSYEDLAADPDVDVVYVATPHSRHEHDTLMFVEAGKHVLCEKPFAPTIEDAVRVVDAAEQRGLTLMVSQNYRFFPATRKAAELVQTKALGPSGPVAIDFRRYANTAAVGTNKHYLLHHPLLFDMSIHHFDLMRMILGQEPVEIYCKVTDPAWSRFNEEASVAATITFDSGATVSYRGSWVSTGPQTPWAGEWRIDCEDGQIAFASRNGQGLSGDWVTTQEIGGEATSVKLPKLPYTGRAGALATFAAAVATGQEPESSGRANLGSLALMFAAARSASSGKVERVEAIAG